MKCVICEVRKPRRSCPGVQGDICSVCCGSERENTVDCPFDCVYLREARAREKPNDITALESVPFLDIRVPERFLRENSTTAQMVAMTVVEAVLSTPGAIDYDVREALDALIRTYKTLQSGLVYESRPSNPIAANIYDSFQQNVAKRRQEISSRTGTSVRDSDVMAMLLVLQRDEYRYNNGRTRGRAFLHHLSSFFPDQPAAMNPQASSLIV